MKILGFESSCDETSAAVLEIDGAGKMTVLSNIVASQIDIHARFGGVVPEIASRAHAEAASKTAYEAMVAAKTDMKDIDAVAVTSEPGLIGALLVGVNFAKALAYANKKPLIAVNHIKGHIAANYITSPNLTPPYLALVASGGHTSIILVEDYINMRVIGATRDDALGESFDKVARVLGMPYPGGAAMDALAYKGRASIKFPSAAIKDGTLDFSFSGIKTAVLSYINSARQRGDGLCREDIAASFVAAAVSSVKTKIAEALDRYPDITAFAIAGGVAANSHLRAALCDLCESRGIGFYLPELKYCGDNAAMICAAAYFEYKAGNFSSTSLNARAVTDI